LSDFSCSGAAISLIVSTSLVPIFLAVYIKCRKLHKLTWGGWSFESLTEWWQFVRLGAFGYLMMVFEWWSFEVSTIVLGSIDETELAINTVLLQYGTTLYMVSY